MYEKIILMVVAASIGLVGKIVFDWLKGRKEPKEILTLEMVTKAIKESLKSFEQSIKKDMDLLISKSDNNYVTRDKHDELENKVEDLTIKMTRLEERIKNIKAG
jgi:hypothetical protein